MFNYTLCYHSDFQIKIVSLEDYVTIGCFTEHVAPVLTVQFDPVGEFLVSTDLMTSFSYVNTIYSQGLKFLWCTS